MKENDAIIKRGRVQRKEADAPSVIPPEELSEKELEKKLAQDYRDFLLSSQQNRLDNILIQK